MMDPSTATSETPPRSNRSNRRTAPTEVVTFKTFTDSMMPFVLSAATAPPPACLGEDDDDNFAPLFAVNNRMLLPPLSSSSSRMEDDEVSSASSDSFSPIQSTKKILYEDSGSSDPPTVASVSSCSASSLSSPDSLSSLSSSAFLPPQKLARKQQKQQRRRVHFQGVAAMDDDSPSQTSLSSSSVGGGSSSSFFLKEGATRAQLLDRVEHLEQQVLKYQVELSSEKSQRKRKTKSLAKIVKEMGRRQSIVEKMTQSMRQMTAMVSETKTRLAEAESDNKRLLQLLMVKRKASKPKKILRFDDETVSNCNLRAERGQQPPPLPLLVTERNRISTDTRRKVAASRRRRLPDDEDTLYNSLVSNFVILSVVISLTLIWNAHHDVFSEEWLCSSSSAFHPWCGLDSLRAWEKPKETPMPVTSSKSQRHLDGAERQVSFLDDLLELPSPAAKKQPNILLQATFGYHYQSTNSMQYF